MNQSLEIDMKEITFSKYFNRNNNSQFTQNDHSLLETTNSTSIKYQTLQVIVKEARFINQIQRIETMSSSVSVVYGSQYAETKSARNEQMNPRWHETINIILNYNGQLIFPETIELLVKSEHIQVIVQILLSLRELAETIQINDWFCLVDQKQITGSLYLSFRFFMSKIISAPKEERSTQSCTEQPINTIIPDSVIPQFKMFELKNVQVRSFPDQLQILKHLTQNYQSFLDNMRSSFDRQKIHPKSNGSIITNYFQNYQQQQLKNQEYFNLTKIDTAPNQYKISIKAQGSQAKIQKAKQNLEQIQKQKSFTEQNIIDLDKINSHSMENNYEINEKNTTNQKLLDDKTQLLMQSKILEDQIKINKNHLMRDLYFQSGKKNLLQKLYRNNQQKTKFLQGILLDKINDQVDELERRQIIRVKNLYDLDDYSKDHYWQWRLYSRI